MPKTDELPDVMPCRPIDGKYTAAWDHVNERVVIINVHTKAILPNDEPLMLFRAKDSLMRTLIAHYHALCRNSGCGPEMLEGIRTEVRRVEKFAADHPERMKTPD